MYSYSPIESMAIKNFRNIGDITIDFTDSPIVSLIGDNEAGKTSVVKAFGVLASHMNGRDQKGFIRDGTSGFGVAIQLADKTLIVRMKTSTLNKYQVKYPNGEVWETNKIDSGLPLQVQQLMGIVEESETKEYLQIRTYEDKLLFVVTPASTNYKVMYDALKVDQITRAIKAGSQESNKYKSTINEHEISIRALTDNLRSIKVIDIESLLNIKNRLTTQLGILEKFERANRVLETVKTLDKQLGVLALLKKHNVQQINESTAMRMQTIYTFFERISKLNKCLSNYSDLDTLNRLDEAQISKFEAIMTRLAERERIKSGVGLYLNLANLDRLDEVTATNLVRAYQLHKFIGNKQAEIRSISLVGCKEVTEGEIISAQSMYKVMQLNSHITALNAAKQQCDSYTKSVEDYLKQLGIATSTCTSCGETVIFDLSILSEEIDTK